MADANSSSSASTVLLQKAKNWCNTELRAVKCCYFIWNIKNFSCYAMGVGQCLDSSTFSSSADDSNPSAEQLKWKLRLYPNGCREETRDFVSLSLHLVQHNRGGAAKINAKFKFAILNAKREQTNAKCNAHEFVQGEKGWGWQSFIRRDILTNAQSGLLREGCLSVFCEVSVLLEEIHESGKQSAPPGQQRCRIPESHLADDFGALLEKSSFWDCVLCSDGKEFKVYKGVLAFRSPVFAAMFSNDTEEERTNRVEIEDVSAPVLSQLLHFLYTGQAPPLLAEQDMAEGLLVTAHRYQLGRLKALCEQQLSTGLTNGNACDVLVLAARHSADQLKNKAIEHIRVHANEVLESAGWRTLISTQSHNALLTQVVKAMAVEPTQNHHEIMATDQPPRTGQ